MFCYFPCAGRESLAKGKEVAQKAKPQAAKAKAAPKKAAPSLPKSTKRPPAETLPANARAATREPGMVTTGSVFSPFFPPVPWFFL